MADSLVDAALMLRAIVNDKRAEPSDRIKAAELMFNRFASASARSGSQIGERLFSSSRCE